MQSIVREVAHIPMPAFNGDQLYMHHVQVDNPKVPAQFKRWTSFVEALMMFVPLDRGEVYLTIDEKELQPSQTHRRGGAHIDGIWYPAIKAHGTTPTHGSPAPEPARRGSHEAPGRGGHIRMRSVGPQDRGGWGDDVEAYHPGGGLLLISNIEGCRGWNGEYEAKFGEGGDLEHIREHLESMPSLVMRPHHLYQCNVFGVHESIPVQEPVQRSLVRITMPADAIIH